MNTEPAINKFVQFQTKIFEKYMIMEDYLVEITLTSLEVDNLDEARSCVHMLKTIKEIQHKVVAFLLLTEKYNTTIEEQRMKIDEILQKVLVN